MAKKSLIAKAKREQKYKTRYYNRCKICGRPRGYLRKFEMCRICFRKLASEGMIPSERSFDDVDAIEEERRMFYVALTRAADWLYVCHAETHYERQGRFGGWNGWDDGGYREVTRFLSPRAHGAFDLQQASQFQLEDNIAPRKRKADSKSKSRRRPANKRKKTGRIRS